MVYLGFSIASFMYISVCILFVVFIGSSMFKKFKFADNLLPILFLHNIFCIFILCWGLIVMNKGFDINFDLGLDFTLLIVLFIPILMIVEFQDYRIRKYLSMNKNITISDGKSKITYRYLLSTITTLLFFISTIIYYFTTHYFVFLNTW